MVAAGLRVHRSSLPATFVCLVAAQADKVAAGFVAICRPILSRLVFFSSLFGLGASASAFSFSGSPQFWRGSLLPRPWKTSGDMGGATTPVSPAL